MCNRLKAAIMQNIAKFQNNDVSGVFAVQCARHQFFEPGGMVDLQKGERYVSTSIIMNIMEALKGEKDIATATTLWVLCLSSIKTTCISFTATTLNAKIARIGSSVSVNGFQIWFLLSSVWLAAYPRCTSKIIRTIVCISIHSITPHALAALAAKVLRPHGQKQTKPLAVQKRRITATVMIP